MNAQQERELRYFVALGSGLLENVGTPEEGYPRVIRALGDVPRPDRLYATVFVAEETELSYSDEYRHDSTVEGRILHDLYVPTRAMVDVMFYRSGASETARRFREWTKYSEALLQCDRRRDGFKLGFRLQHPIGDITNYEVMVNAIREQQALLRLTLDYTDVIREDVPAISQVSGNVKTDHDERSFLTDPV